MCGIVGIIGRQPVTERLVQGLRRLEYRGYDSAGIATLHHHQINLCRSEGNINKLNEKLRSLPLKGHLGIAHTRWATHGIPSERNAHPHITDLVAIVHNGIIENHEDLRQFFPDYSWQSDTDSEVVAAMLTHYLNHGYEPVSAVRDMLPQLKGNFALAIICRDYPDILIGARRGSPLAVGYGEGEMFLGSDALALSHLSQQLTYLEDDDFVVLTKDSATFYNALGKIVPRQVVQSHFTEDTVSKGNFDSFMMKEIHDQPTVVRQLLTHYMDSGAGLVNPHALNFDIERSGHLYIVACGSSYYAAAVAKYWIEKLAHIPVHVDIASEFRYRKPALRPYDKVLFISQSGETLDTMAAVTWVKEQKIATTAIVNVPESSIARAVDQVFLLHAGPEIGVASTKAFTAQLCLLLLLTLSLGENHGILSVAEIQVYTRDFYTLPNTLDNILSFHADELEKMAKKISKSSNVLFLGRGSMYPIALEGALKLKELSYIHGEGYPAGEMKHGPIALVDKKMPVIFAAPTDMLFEKTASNIQEIMARGGQVYILTDKNGAEHFPGSRTIILPTIHPLFAPIMYSLPMQLIAYHAAIARGNNVDQPRNLAKSVTVE